MPTANVEDQAERAKNRIIEIQSSLFTKSIAYTNLILIGGYAGAFTVWSYTKPQLPAKANVATALLLGISLAVFIFFEVYKMAQNAIHFNRTLKAISAATSPADFLAKWKAVEASDAKANITSVRIWAICLAICVMSALSAVAILFYNFAAVLCGLPNWPA